MIKRKFVQILTICFQVCLLVVLFLPTTKNYDVTQTLWDKIAESFKTSDTSAILTYSFYYLPVIITMMLIAVFRGRIRYVLASVSSSFGLALTLILFIFPAVGSPYLFLTYQTGLYILIILEIITVIMCVIGVSLRLPKDDIETYLGTKSDTQELPIEDINKQLNI